MCEADDENGRVEVLDPLEVGMGVVGGRRAVQLAAVHEHFDERTGRLLGVVQTSDLVVVAHVDHVVLLLLFAARRRAVQKNGAAVAARDLCWRVRAGRLAERRNQARLANIAHSRVVVSRRRVRHHLVRVTELTCHKHKTKCTHSLIKTSYK